MFCMMLWPAKTSWLLPQVSSVLVAQRRRLHFPVDQCLVHATIQTSIVDSPTDNNNEYAIVLARRHQVRVTQLNSVQTGLF